MIKFKSKKEMLEYLEEFSPESILCDGFEKAMVGVIEIQAGLVVAYDREKCITTFQKDGMTPEEALEYFEYNTIRALPYMGELAPVFIVGMKK